MIVILRLENETYDMGVFPILILIPIYVFLQS